MPRATIWLVTTLFPALALAEKPLAKEESPPAGAIRAGDPAWKLVWSDEFDTPGLPDTKKWSYEVGRVRNREAQLYTEARKENARVEGGALVIEARKEKREGAEYTSASLHTKGKGEWRRGRIEVRARLPTGRGTWPAIWTLGVNMKEVGWPRCGEIDIMENVGFAPDVIHANIHTRAYNHIENTNKGDKITVAKPYEDFHVYAVEWLDDRLDFFVDGKRYFTYKNDKKGEDSWPFDRPQYLLLNLAIGGSWGGQKGIDDAIFPQRLLVDYVRVYERKQAESAEAVPDGFRPGIFVGSDSFAKSRVLLMPELGGISEIVGHRWRSGPEEAIVVSGTAGAVVLKPATYEVLERVKLNEGAAPFLRHRAIDIDGDGDVEFLREPGPGHGVVLLDESGKQLWTRAPPGKGFPAMAVGDVDGDRCMEVLLHSDSSKVSLLDCQGHVLWSNSWESPPVQVVLTDTDGDRAAEIVAIEGKAFCIRDGKGAIRLREEVAGAGYVHMLALARIPGEDWRPAIYLGFNRNQPNGSIEQFFRILDPKESKVLKEGPAVESEQYLTQLSVRLEAGAPPCGAMIWQLNHQGALAGFTATRLLLQIYDVKSALLYEEVIASCDGELAKGEGAIAAVPLSSGQQDRLLVGYGPELLEYRRR